MYSMTEAKLGRPHWVRIGNDTCYYRNHFLRNLSSAGGSKKSTYFTLTFTVTFRHDEDTCYFAYHYPYTYTKLQVPLPIFSSACRNDIIISSVHFTCCLSGVAINFFNNLPVGQIIANVYLPGKSLTCLKQRGTMHFNVQL